MATSRDGDVDWRRGTTTKIYCKAYWSVIVSWCVLGIFFIRRAAGGECKVVAEPENRVEAISIHSEMVELISQTELCSLQELVYSCQVSIAGTELSPDLAHNVLPTDQLTCPDCGGTDQHWLSL